MTVRPLKPPSGELPPMEMELDGLRIDVRGIATEAAYRHHDRHPEDVGRLGPAAHEWCVHDTQWLLTWAILDVQGFTSFAEQLDWLTRVLRARDYPVQHVAESLVTVAELCGEARVAAVLSRGAERIAT